jgi:hypothetical protein
MADGERVYVGVACFWAGLDERRAAVCVCVGGGGVLPDFEIPPRGRAYLQSGRGRVPVGHCGSAGR